MKPFIIGQKSLSIFFNSCFNFVDFLIFFFSALFAADLWRHFFKELSFLFKIDEQMARQILSYVDFLFIFLKKCLEIELSFRFCFRFGLLFNDSFLLLPKNFFKFINKFIFSIRKRLLIIIFFTFIRL